MKARLFLPEAYGAVEGLLVQVWANSGPAWGGFDSLAAFDASSLNFGDWTDIEFVYGGGFAESPVQAMGLEVLGPTAAIEAPILLDSFTVAGVAPSVASYRQDFSADVGGFADLGYGAGTTTLDASEGYLAVSPTFNMSTIHVGSRAPGNIDPGINLADITSIRARVLLSEGLGRRFAVCEILCAKQCSVCGHGRIWPE